MSVNEKSVSPDEALALDIERLAVQIIKLQERCEDLEPTYSRAGYRTSDELGRIKRELYAVAHDLAPELVQRAPVRARRPL